MKIPRAVAHVNKVITNPIQGMWAGRIAPWAKIEHVGRRSGKQYVNPVLAFTNGTSICVPLNYGPESDWVRNVLTAGSFTMQRAGNRLHIAGVRILPADSPDVVKSGRIPAHIAGSVIFGRIVGESKIA